MDMNVIKQEVEMTYKKVKSLAGWTVDDSVVLIITSYYVTSEREFDAESLNRVMDALKERAGWFSPLRGNFPPIISAFLDKPKMDIDQVIAQLFEKQLVLRNVGFRNTIHSYLAALIVTNNPTLYEVEAMQAKKLYDEMKKQHFFLTSDDDYTYAVLLGKMGNDPSEHAKSMRIYYDALREEGFRAGKELQWMSQVMTYVNMTFNLDHVLRAVEVLEHFQQEAKIRPVHYPMIGLLVVFKVTDRDLFNIVELSHTLEESKHLKWKKEMALPISIGYVMHGLTGNIEEASIGRNVTSVELVLQAQQAVIAATIAAISASSAGNPTNT